MTTTTDTHERFFTVATSSPSTLRAYLYSHTEVVREITDPELGSTHFLLRTTADNEARVDYLATYQRERLLSGLHGAGNQTHLTEVDALIAHQERTGFDLSATPQERLRHHVSGAVERGEKESIVGVEVIDHAALQSPCFAAQPVTTTPRSTRTGPASATAPSSTSATAPSCCSTRTAASATSRAATPTCCRCRSTAPTRRSV